MAIDTYDKKRAGLTAGMPFYASSTSLGSPISMSDKWEAAWTYPIGQYNLTLNVADSFNQNDSFASDLAELLAKALADGFTITDDLIASLGEDLVANFADAFGIIDSFVWRIYPIFIRDSRISDLLYDVLNIRLLNAMPISYIDSGEYEIRNVEIE